MIPKIIHQIWIGEKLPPMNLMETWKIQGFKYILWNEEKIDRLNMINRDKYDQFMKEKIYYGAADIARVEILYQHGGLYIDSDTERLKSLPDIWFNFDFFAVETHKDPRWNYRVANGVMASSKHGNVITEYQKRIKESTKIKPCWSTIGGTLLTNILLEKFIEDPTTLILEPYTFYPYGSKGHIEPNASDAYARHYWGSKTKKLYKTNIN